MGTFDGEIVRDPMLNRIKPCVKCGGERVSLRYQSMPPGVLIPDDELAEADNLIITCVRCGYTWEVTPLDREEEEKINDK